MRISLLRLVFPCLLATGLLYCVPASAQTCAGSVQSGFDHVQGTMDCPQPPPTKPQPKQRESKGGGKAVKPACVWVPETDYLPGAGQKADGDGGHWYRKFCSF